MVREHGPGGFSMDVLAKTAGVARATVYEHFRSKRAVLDELATSASRTLTLEPLPHDGDPLTALRDMLDAVCRHWDAHEESVRELSTLAAATGVEPPADAVDRHDLECIVEKLARSGHLRGHWTPDDAVDALALLTSFPTFARLHREPRTASDVEALLARLAVSIVSPTVAPG